jgi:hypothetical protein
MSEYDGTILFKDWLPDLPPLNNPGLVEALNVLPVDRSYKSFAPLSAVSTAGPSRPMGALYPSGANGDVFFDHIYVGAQNALHLYSVSSGWTNMSASTYGTAKNWDFAQFDDLIVAVNGSDVPQHHTLGSSSAFTALASSGTAPVAKAVGVIGQFVMVGNLEASGGESREHVVQWCGIDQPRSWPTPDSATAIAQQSGRQYLPKELGPVQGIYGGDQHGLITQAGGLTRATYVGGGVVFQFDTLSKTHGSAFPNASILVNGLLYFVSSRGFCVTDGVQVQPIGDGKVDRYFLDNVSFTNAERMHAAHDARRKLILWCVPTSTSTAGQPDLMLIYNYEERRWSRTNQVSEVLFTPPSALPQLGAHGFNASNQICTFSGTPGTATLTTGEMEPNPGGYVEEFGIKPLVDATVNAITIAMGTRNDQGEAVSYSSEQTANARSGFANFRTSARYHRARLKIAGTFNAAQGLEYQANAAGYT